MKLKQIKFFILILLLFSMSCRNQEISTSTLESKDAQIESLANQFRQNLLNNEFSKIYDESSEFIKRNSLKGNFIKNLQEIVGELKKVDSKIDWQVSNIFTPSNQFEQLSESNTYKAYRKLENENLKISIFIYWSDEKGNPQLFSFGVQKFNGGKLVTNLDAVHGVIFQKQ